MKLQAVVTSASPDEAKKLYSMHIFFYIFLHICACNTFIGRYRTYYKMYVNMKVSKNNLGSKPTFLTSRGPVEKRNNLCEIPAYLLY